MTSTPRSEGAKSLNDSWVDVTGDCAGGRDSSMRTPNTTPLNSLTDARGSLKSLEKLLLEAQKESNFSSPSVCSASHSQSISPVSPCSPVYPNECMSIVEALMLNREEDLMERKRQINSADWLWDWHARPDILNPEKDFKQKLVEKNRHQKKLSLLEWLEVRGFFSKEVLSFLLLSNILSLILGAGIGYSVLIRKSM